MPLARRAPQKLRADFAPTLSKLADLGFTLYATEETSRFLDERGIRNTLLHFAESGLKPSIDEYLSERKIELVVMLSNQVRGGAADARSRLSTGLTAIPIPLRHGAVLQENYHELCHPAPRR